LPAVVDAEAALRPGAPCVHADLPGNASGTIAVGYGDIERAFAAADLVIRERLRIGRCSGQPMETRGLLARVEPDRAGPRLTIWDSTQSAHMVRRFVAEYLGLPEHAVRVICPDVGGGFGIKNRFYPEELLIPFAALQLGQPVVWVEDRREDLLTSCHAREQLHDVELALRRDGTLLGLRDRFLYDAGAYSMFGLAVPQITAATIPGPYHLEAYAAELTGVYTNKTPVAPYRGAGRPQGVFVMERILDRAARALQMDPVELRRRNLIRADEMPYRRDLVDRDGNQVEYDSGDYLACLDRALDLVDVPAFRAEQARARADGRLLGLGVGAYVEATASNLFEGATVRVENDGRVVVVTGAVNQGQGHETVYAQVCADRLGVRFEDVTVVGGDTGLIPYGVGTFGSRSAVTAGSATGLAATKLREKILEVAAGHFEASPADLELADGQVGVRGVPGQRISLGQLAAAASRPSAVFGYPPDLDPGLEATSYFRVPRATYSNGVHAVVVEVDEATGDVKLLKYTVAHDCGTVLNPLLLDGQIHGGVAQGIGNAFYEEVVYDENGQPLTATLADYLLPTTMDVPEMSVAHLESPTPLNPEGVKGAGEGGTMPGPAIVNAAIEDALAHLPLELNETPLNPAKLRTAIVAARASS
ncbi:MAG: molybdopterin-dependent oxidoreductase, partial [Chloroflexi bacterium]|nr:molybdopterin-dependent oxidoreductase [Chloroflexota bacterium]